MTASGQREARSGQLAARAQLTATGYRLSSTLLPAGAGADGSELGLSCELTAGQLRAGTWPSSVARSSQLGRQLAAPSWGRQLPAARPMHSPAAPFTGYPVRPLVCAALLVAGLGRSASPQAESNRRPMFTSTDVVF